MDNGNQVINIKISLTFRFKRVLEGYLYFFRYFEMKKSLVALFFALLLSSSVFWYRGSCTPADEESDCACKARDNDLTKPIDQGIYQSCMAEVNVKKNEEANKKAETEHKQAALEEKIRKLEEKTNATEEKVATVLEKKMTQEEATAYASLKEKVVIIESLVGAIKEKDAETQAKVRAVLEVFKLSKDEYTKNIGLYLSYLLR